MITRDNNVSIECKNEFHKHEDFIDRKLFTSKKTDVQRSLTLPTLKKTINTSLSCLSECLFLEFMLLPRRNFFRMQNFYFYIFQVGLAVNRVA